MTTATTPPHLAPPAAAARPAPPGALALVWRLASARPLLMLRHEGLITCMAWRPDGAVLAVATEKETFLYSIHPESPTEAPAQGAD